MQVLELDGTVTAAVEVAEFTVDAILAFREETRDDYDPEEGSGAALIEEATCAGLQIIKLYNSEGEMSMYVKPN